MATMKKESSYLDRDDILAGIAELARSQGLYGRVLRVLEELKEENPDKYDRVMTELEDQHFTTFLDFILWFEG